MSNPIDDYLQTKSLQKTAGPFQGTLPGMKRYMGGGIGQKMLDGAAQAAGAGALAGGSALLGVAAMKVYRAARKAGEFKAMLAHAPDLAEHQQQDPAGFNARYNSLRSMAPAYASDPVISASLMRNMSLNPETAGSVLMQAAESRAKTSPSLGIKSDPFSIGF